MLRRDGPAAQPSLDGPMLPLRMPGRAGPLPPPNPNVKLPVPRLPGAVVGGAAPPVCIGELAALSGMRKAGTGEAGSAALPRRSDAVRSCVLAVLTLPRVFLAAVVLRVLSAARGVSWCGTPGICAARPALLDPRKASGSVLRPAVVHNLRMTSS